MTKLLNNFRAEPTAANLAKLKAYMAKHPMASCMLSLEDIQFLRQHGL